MPSFTESIPTMTTALADRFGEGRPAGDDPGTFAAIATAFLSRDGDERAVRSAIDALRDAGLIDPRRLAEADPVAVEESWRSSGARTLVKSARGLRRLAEWVVETIPDDDQSPSTEALRESLRAIKGIGPATADAILLDGLGRSAYPVDRASYRILVRHGWLDAEAGYDEARDLIEGGFAADVRALRNVSTWFERVGREACKASVAHCERCPLRGLLPEGGPRESS